MQFRSCQTFAGALASDLQHERPLRVGTAATGQLCEARARRRSSQAACLVRSSSSNWRVGVGPLPCGRALSSIFRLIASQRARGAGERIADQRDHQQRRAHHALSGSAGSAEPSRASGDAAASHVDLADAVLGCCLAVAFARRTTAETHGTDVGATRHGWPRCVSGSTKALQCEMGLARGWPNLARPLAGSGELGPVLLGSRVVFAGATLVDGRPGSSLRVRGCGWRNAAASRVNVKSARRPTGAL